jgi:hypothetical protein
MPRRLCSSSAWLPAASRVRSERAAGAVRPGPGVSTGAQRDPQPEAGARLAGRIRRRLVAHPSQASIVPPGFW